jgi:phosphoribosylformylglycinamidine synthase
VRAAAAPPLPPEDCAADLLSLLQSARWVFRQYDHQLFLNTVVGPGADAALLRLAGPGLPHSERGVAITTDSNPRACALDPRRGTARVLAEGVANLACVGASPVAVVNCLNFGNPEHPEVMWQLSETIDGLTEGCQALSLPVIGGNVSLYNESAGADIDPTPVLGLLGLVEAVRARPPGLAWSSDQTLVVLGPPAPTSLEGTLWATQRRRHRDGTLPAVDFATHAVVCAFVASLVSAQVAGASGLVAAVHDVSSGGLALALAEMAAESASGCRAEVGDAFSLFSESPSRFVLATDDPEELTRRATAAGVTLEVLGRTGGDRFVLGHLIDLPLSEVQEAYSENLPRKLYES